MISSPTEPSTSTYHVTMEDGDEAETGIISDNYSLVILYIQGILLAIM